MEIFVFLRMKTKPDESAKQDEPSKQDEIVVELLNGTSNGRAELAGRLSTFDAGKAECYADEDRQRLLAVIEASFGTFAPFNDIVRKELLNRDVLERHASVREKIAR